MKKLMYVMCAVAALGLGVMAGCQKEEPAPKGGSVNDAIDATADKVKEGAEKAEEAAKETAEEVEKAAEDAQK